MFETISVDGRASGGSALRAWHCVEQASPGTPLEIMPYPNPPSAEKNQQGRFQARFRECEVESADFGDEKSTTG